MKKLLIVAAIAAALWPTNSKAEIQNDKIAHFSLSFAINAASYGLCQVIVRGSNERASFAQQFQLVEPAQDHTAFCRVFGVFTAAMAGLVKEGMDRSRGASLADSRGDLIADGLGIATFTILSIALDF